MSKLPVIPGYKMVSKLGEGGMATVYMGIQEKLNRKVAIKILEPSLLRNTVIAARFMIEAETAAKLSHSSIISIFDIGHTDEHQYIVMEYLEETLKDHLFGYPQFRLKPQRAIEILKPIANALDYAHGKGIIHRDIKTDNIMFREDGTPVVLDFGIARALDSNTQMTRTGISLGTPFYMSPEQCQAETLDGRSDIYSLGVVFYELLTAEKPYNAENPTAVALKHIQDPLPRIPGEFAHYQLLLDKMMAKNREDRVANGKELIKLMDSLMISENNAFPTAMEAEQETRPAEPPNLPIPEEEEDFIDLPIIEKTPVRPMKTPGVKKVLKRSVSTKTILESLLLVGLLIAIFVIFFYLGQDSGSRSESTVKPVKVSAAKPSEVKVDASAQFRQNIIDVQKYIEEENFEKAGELLDILKKAAQENGNTADSLELEKLQDRLSNEQSFNNLFKNAQENIRNRKYRAARDDIARALEIKSTPELAEMQRVIDKAIGKVAATVRRKNARQKQLRAKDDNDFRFAVTINTVDAFQNYIHQYPNGRHLNEAMATIGRIREAEQLRKLEARKKKITTVNLRTKYKSLSMEAAQSMIKQRKFFDNDFNKRGKFKNHFSKVDSNGITMVLAKATRLMWYGSSVSRGLSYKKADKWVKGLNRRKHGGFTNWRMPTLEEAASLLHANKNAFGLHLSSLFQIRTKTIWSCDPARQQTQWVIRFDTGTIFPALRGSKQQVLAVRSAN